MIEYIEGDLFDTQCVVIAHGCNAQGVMGGGVAKIIRDKFPEAYESYKKAFPYTMGDVIFEMSKGKIIANMITQKIFGSGPTRYVSYDAVDLAMKKLNIVLTESNIFTVAMPKIGAGLGGGNWNIIERIIEENLKDIHVRVYVI